MPSVMVAGLPAAAPLVAAARTLTERRAPNARWTLPLKDSIAVGALDRMHLHTSALFVFRLRRKVIRQRLRCTSVSPSARHHGTARPWRGGVVEGACGAHAAPPVICAGGGGAASAALSTLRNWLSTG